MSKISRKIHSEEQVHIAVEKNEITVETEEELT
ncbi:hypothetical protein A2U01_0060589, partial [Trifolium medium]|nr:hypothetical protein [Trifolium medium]